jgi:ABC-2 type transport system ATP-binding protein
MIEVVGLRKRYGRTVAVDDLSFSAGAGKVTGFLGPRGAGKSTTLRMIAGLDIPDAGFVRIDGDGRRPPRHRARVVGAVLDTPWLRPNVSARAHLSWLARCGGLPAHRADDVLDQVGLTQDATAPANGLGGAASRRLAVAAALLGDPPVLLFDEPGNGLPEESISWQRRFMHELAGEGRTVLVAGRQLSEISSTAHELVIIDGGKLIARTSTTAPARTRVAAGSSRRPRCA